MSETLEQVADQLGLELRFTRRPGNAWEIELVNADGSAAFTAGHPTIVGAADSTRRILATQDEGKKGTRK